MVTIKDIRSITPRSNRTRAINTITHIARHHSATDTGDWASFWKYWHETKGWGTGGYHEIILRDGTVQLCYDPEEITNGVGGQNAYTYHITLVGNGSFTPAQEKAWEERVLYNLKRFKLPANKVLGHKEFPGAQTACPATDMGVVRNRIIYLQNKEVADAKAKAEAIAKAKAEAAKPVAKKILYRVVAGSFADKENAEEQVKALKKAGFESFISS